MGESFLNRIIQSGTPPAPSGYVRLAGVPDGESIIANAPIIENGGVNYYPIYYMCLMDTLASESFTKTGTGVSSGADAYVFSDEPSTLYVGDTTHTFDVADDYATSENWKCRYVIAYATETNKNDANGITINLYLNKTSFEFIGSQYLKLSSTSALFGYTSSSSVNQNLRYVNLSNSSFYNNEIYVSNFCRFCSSLTSISLPYLTTVSGGSFCRDCSSLTSISLPSLTTVSGSNFCNYCYSLTSISLPSLTTVSGSNFCNYCYSLTSISLPSLTTVSREYFCSACSSLTSISLPSLTTVSGEGFCSNCYSLTSISLPSLTTVSREYFCYYCSSLTSISLPSLTTVSRSYFCYECNHLEYFEIPSTITAITNTTPTTLNYVQFIKLPTNFDIDACNFTGYSGYSKSLTWFTHLATQLKDNSGGTAKTMVLGADNIALIPTATATIISNKNWTLS